MDYLRNGILIVFLGLFLSCAPATDSPTKDEPPEHIVELLYHDFEWEILTEDNSKVFLMDQPKAVLNRYFTPKLADLIMKDRKDSETTGDIGRLDFDLMCGSQDNGGIGNVRIIRKAGTNVIAVLYDQNGEKDVMEIDFYTVKTRSGWRISDIHYAQRKSTAFPDPTPELSLFEHLSLPDVKCK